jgi:hypothetical protein
LSTHLHLGLPRICGYGVKCVAVTLEKIAISSR